MKKVTIIAVVFLIISTTSILALANQEIIAQIVPFKIFVNGIQTTFDKSIVTINDNTYIPLREAAETLGMDVNWNEENQIITINNPSSVNQDLLLHPFESGGLWGYKDNQGNVVVAPEYVEALEFKENMGLVCKSSGQNGQYGFINEKGVLVIPCIYYMAYSFNNDVALVSLATNTEEGKWTYIDKQGNRLFNKEFTLAHSFSENYAVVLKEGYGFPVPPSIDVQKKWSYINKSGEFVTEISFEDAKDFHNGYAGVKNNGKWGLIDKNFNLVIPYQYDDIGTFENGMIPVKEGDVWRIHRCQ